MSEVVAQQRRVAVVLAAEALLALGVAGWQLLGLSQGEAGRPEVAWGSSTYFLLLAAIIATFAFATARGARWVYGPAVFLQVLGLPLAVTMAGRCPAGRGGCGGPGAAAARTRSAGVRARHARHAVAGGARTGSGRH
jgi:hypothetical protein